MSADRLEGARAEEFLSASAALAREAATSPTWFEPAVRALEAAYTERPLLPAPVLVFDLTALLHGERVLPVTPPAVDAVREALRGYEDHVLARLTADRRWTRLCEAIAALPKTLHATAVGLIATQLLQRLGLDAGVGISTGVVRRFAAKAPDQVLNAGRLAVYDNELAAQLVEGLTMLAKAARRTRDLLSDAEVFLVENLAALKTLAARVALTQLAEVAQLVDEQLPARLRGQVFEDGDAPTALEEDSAFPVGGFSSISTSGSIENLVTSELIYMENGDARPDLFDVRFVENELLYYSRDESVSVRRKRVLALVFDASLSQWAVKDAGEKYQRLVWLFGAVTALIRKLSAWLDTEALRFELIFVVEREEPVLHEEEGVLGLVLREYRERGQVELLRAESASRAVRDVHQRHGARARAMVFAAKFPDGLDGDSAPDAIVTASGSSPRVHWSSPSLERAASTEGALAAWSQVALQLLDGVLKRPASGVARSAKLQQK
ncbi:MAG: hypothetical protein ACO1OB_30625 [Archangium sp.]